MSNSNSSTPSAPGQPSDKLPSNWHPVGSANYNVEPEGNTAGDNDVPTGQYLPPSQ